MAAVSITLVPGTITESGRLGFPVGIVLPPAIMYDMGGATLSPYVYVVDSGNNRVQAFQYDGTFAFSFGSFGSGNGQFNNPFGVTTDGTHVFVTDRGNNRVQIFTMFGVYVSQFGSAGTAIGQFNVPMGIAVDNQYIWIVDSDNNRFQVATLDGTVFYSQSTYVLDGVTYNFSAPTTCQVDAEYFYIFNSGTGQELRFPKDLSVGYQGSVTLPKRTVSGAFTGQWWSAAVTLKKREVTGQLTSQGLFSGSVTLKKRTVSGEFSTENKFSGTVTLPKRSVSGAFSTFVNFSADITLKKRSVVGSFTANGTFSANIVLPRRSVSGIIDQVLSEVYRAIAINSENFAVTEYTNYPFNSMCEFNGKYYASGTNGITRLDGDTDLSSKPIVPVVRFGRIDLHKGGVKSLMNSYFTGITNEKANIKIVYDKDEDEPFTDGIEETDGSEAVRVKVPQGMKKKRLVEVEITGADEIINYRTIIEPIPGRVR